MNALELQAPSRLQEWYIALASGFTFAFIAFVLLDRVTPHSRMAFWIIWPIVAWHLSTTRQSIQILDSHPPTLITSTVWFGIIKTDKRCELPGLVWTQVVIAGRKSGMLRIEGGTHGYTTTPLVYLPWSEENEEKAVALCAKLAEFLKLEDKGYPFGTPIAKLDQAVVGKGTGWLFLAILILISVFLLIVAKNVSDMLEPIATLFGVCTPIALLFIALGRRQEKDVLRKENLKPPDKQGRNE